MKNRVNKKLAGHQVPSARLGPLLLAGIFAAAMAFSAAQAAVEYTFTPIAFLGDSAPGGGTLVNDFEPTAINNQGALVFTADLGPGEEVTCLSRAGTLTPLARFGQLAPGGGVLGAVLGNVGLNDEGDAALAFTLEPLQFFMYRDGIPAGAVGGVYRYSHSTGNLTRLAATGTPVPGGGTFIGVSGDVSRNNRGTVAFCGIVGFGDNPEAGVFLADPAGNITSVAVPGMRAPNGGTWTTLGMPHLNNCGDLAFGGGVGPATLAAASVYQRRFATGEILTIAGAGDPLPGGGVLQAALWPRINDAGEVLFGGALEALVSPVYTGPAGLYLHTGRTLVRVAGSGDAMPGGGHINLIPALDWTWGFNNRSEAAFMARLDTTEMLPTGDEGLYVYSGGVLHLIARSGTVIPGLGTIFSLETGNSMAPGLPPSPTGFPTGGAQLNERGQTFFGCSLTDGRVVLLLATPTMRARASSNSQ